MALPTRKLGNIECSAVGFGAMSLTPGFYGSGQDLVESEKVLRAALDSGITLINTADFYTGVAEGEDVSANIKLIGKVLKDYPREKVVVVMKWGPWITPGATPPFSADLSPAQCKKRVDDALKILGTDYIDVLVLRKAPIPEQSGTSLEDTAKAMKEVLEAGKVKAVGISEYPLDEAKRIHSVVPVSAIELELNLFSRDMEKEVIPWARTIGAGILAYSPMARGMLTGKMDLGSLDKDDFRHHHSRWSQEAFDNNQKLVAEVEKLAASKNCSAGQLALAWVLAQGEDVVPIPGTKRVKYLEENIKALDVKLTDVEVKELSSVIPPEAVQGSRY